MEILTASCAGFCEGVERAYRIALEQTKAGKLVYMLGNLVHNTQVIDKFKQLGVKTVKTIAEIPDNSKGILLISAHGVAPQVYDQANNKHLEIIDTTCSWVKKAQRIAREQVAAGRQVIIFGDKGHVEVKGIVGWSNNTALVVESLADLKALALDQKAKISVLAQTTQSAKDFTKIVAALKKQIKDVKEFATICGATSKRQNAAADLAKQVDLMLVVGDKLSANTKRLTELCKRTGTATHQIQTANELDKNWLKNKQKVGVTAGASTPDWTIKEVVELLKNS